MGNTIHRTYICIPHVTSADNMCDYIEYRIHDFIIEPSNNEKISIYNVKKQGWKLHVN